MHTVRHTLRQLAKTPAFTAVAILTLAVGIGSTAAMYSTLRALVVEPLPYPASDELVHVWSNDGQPLSQPDTFDVMDRSTCFAELGVYSPQAANLGGEKPQSITSVSCTPGVLRALGIAPALGRLLTDADEKQGAPSVVVIGDALWHNSFGGDPHILGRDIRVNGANTTVVGVMPPHFEFASPWMRTLSAQMWVPLQLKRGDGDRGSHWLCMVGRLKPGVPVATADAQIKAIGAQLKAEYPKSNARKPFLVRPLLFEVTRGTAPRVWLLFGAVVLVLLIACANVASMLLARNARRQGEFGIRVALGALRRDIVKLTLIESTLLAAGGAVGGSLLAVVGTRVLAMIAPVTAERRAAMGLDGGVLAFTVGVALIAALLAGLPPALASLRLPVTELLRADSRSTTGSRTRHNFLRGLIVGQVALALALANAAALFSAAYVKLLQVNRPLATEYVLSARIQLRGERYDKRETRAQFTEQIAERVAALPGVSAAGTTNKLPLEGGSNMTILVNDETFDPTAERILAEVSSVTSGYFQAAGIALLRGRTLQPSDAEGENPGIVVNRAFAEKAWPGENPLGKPVRQNSDKPEFTARVVGVVDDVRQWGPETPARPELYWSPNRSWGRYLFIVLRSTQPASRFAPEIRHALDSLDPDLPLADVRTLQQVVDQATQGQRAIVQMIDFFMALALGLVAVGLYGTLSYHVLQRTREIGVRVALGATAADVLRLVFRQGLGWVLVGAVLGLVGALALTSTLKSIVYGMESVDPLSLAIAVVVIAAATLLACWIPARRAAKLDPTEALRATG
ncbi:permease [Opitutaceae bacterium EW11]|nr:permease [Opitutaceae bacterium EW11]